MPLRRHQQPARNATAPASPPHTKPATRSASTVARRATRQTTDTAPPPIPWANDPEPRRRRGPAIPSSAAPVHGDGEQDADEDEEAEPQDGRPADALSLRDSNARRSCPWPAPAAVSGATDKRPDHQRRPVLLQTTNQADPAPVPKPVARNRAARLHAAPALRNGATAALPVAAPTQLDQPAFSRRRGSAVAPPLHRLPQPSSPLQSHHKTEPFTAVPIMTQAHPRSVKILNPVAANTSKPVLPAVTLSAAPSPPRPAKKQMPAQQQADQRKPGIINRNIDKVVFGNICFSTWYHSPYGTEALEAISVNVKANSVNGVQDGGNKEEALSYPNRRAKEERLDRLYVCPSCFKYSKELVPWWQHVHQCERRGYVPGRKIYTHPKGRRVRHVSAGAPAMPKGPGRKRKASDAAPAPVGEDVQDEGEWSIWEVDGEEEGLFCQNLSLFAKLFLDNKSVFFDVVGFKYFLLVHAVPRPPSDDSASLPPTVQVVGFFSKEKLSWDNNNLACILVFPPWQRKGLGALLMGASYEISRREGMLGGPEKPISDLGKKGYKRFWAGEIAAWLLSLDTSGEGEAVVDVHECSKATWIVPEDCLMVLREMGVVEEAEAGPPKKRKRAGDASSAGDGNENVHAAAVDEEAEEKLQDVPRVRTSKQAVWDWVRANRITLEFACDPDGFIEGYAVKETGIEDVEDV